MVNQYEAYQGATGPLHELNSKGNDYAQLLMKAAAANKIPGPLSAAQAVEKTWSTFPSARAGATPDGGFLVAFASMNATVNPPTPAAVAGSFLSQIPVIGPLAGAVQAVAQMAQENPVVNQAAAVVAQTAMQAAGAIAQVQVGALQVGGAVLGYQLQGVADIVTMKTARDLLSMGGYNPQTIAGAGIPSTAPAVAGAQADTPEQLAAKAKDKNEWMKIAAGLGIAAAVAAGIWLMVRGKSKGSKKKKKKKSKTKEPKEKPAKKGKRFTRGRGRGGKSGKGKGAKRKTRADIRYPASAGPEKRGKHKSPGSGKLADERKGGGVSDKTKEVRRLRALLKGAKKTAAGNSTMKATAKKAVVGIKKKLRELHAR